jgi:aminobenzoyl-glutamate utilization protein B
MPRRSCAAICRQAQLNSTSDDYTDMTWHAPTARFYIARPALKAPPGTAYPAWVMNALGGIPATIDPMVQTAAKVLALSALRVLEDETARTAAMEEFAPAPAAASAAPTGRAPLCDYDPPIHFRWPEYVTTPRGRDWWIPSAMPGA